MSPYHHKFTLLAQLQSLKYLNWSEQSLSIVHLGLFKPIPPRFACLSLSFLIHFILDLIVHRRSKNQVVHTKETRIERDTHTPIFTAALFTTARTQKQPRYPSADEQIRKCGTYTTMEYYAA